MLRLIEIHGFKSFAKKTPLSFESRIVGIVGPNGSGKSNVAEAFRFVLGEQSMKTMRGAKGEDMIWSGSVLVPKANRASVAMEFDNRKRLFAMDADSVTIERVVFRDGKNEYRINGSTSRLKDIHELLASIHIGTSRHHIISQGQADRILNASTTERAEMLEDALGLTSIELKKSESEFKLEKTVEHEREVALLRKEAAPRLAYLKKQIERKEKADLLKEEMIQLVQSYVKIESAYIDATRSTLIAESKEPRARLESLELELEKLRTQFRKANTQDVQSDQNNKERAAIQRQMQTVDQKVRELYAERASLEYTLRQKQTPNDSTIFVPAKDIERVEQRVTDEERRARVDGEYARHLTAAVKEVTTFSNNALTAKQSKEPTIDPVRLQAELERVHVAISRAEDERASLTTKLSQFTAQSVSQDVTKIEQERDILRITAQISELRSYVRDYDSKAQAVAHQQSQLDQLIAEFKDIVPTTKKGTSEDAPHWSEAGQEASRAKLLRLKIRQEEFGSIDDEILKEYTDAAARDAFLERELTDLAQAREALHELIGALTEELQTKFSDGIKLINTEFLKYFKILFDGGEAKLVETKEEKRSRGETDDAEVPKKTQRGVDVSVHLPRKRVSSLAILSGGERALTSIALIFAMSQIHPPPFIILDETDAALDEANSSRYAEIIKALSDRSQLIVITHNRATMAAAGTLFGITMGGDGVSKLLSVKLEEAVRVAK
jgi:chromosome segregation protein